MTNHADKPLDETERKFVDGIITHGVVQRAALEAGYSASTASTKAYSWLMDDNRNPKPHVWAEIKRRRNLIADRVNKKVDNLAEKVIEEWTKLAFLDIGDILVRDENGAPIVNGKFLKIDWSKITKDQTAAIAEIAPDGKVKFIAKDGVLRDIARHLGLFQKDAPQVNLTLTLEQLITAAAKERHARENPKVEEKPNE